MAGPSASQPSPKLLQPVGACGKIDLRKENGDKIDGRDSCFHGGRAFQRRLVSLAHLFEKLNFIAPIVNQHRLLDGFEEGEEFPPGWVAPRSTGCPSSSRAP